MVKTNDEKSNVTTSKAAAKEVTKPANNILTPAARMLQHILSSRTLLIMRKTMILEALNQAENEAEAKVEAALARKDDLKSDKAEVDKDDDKGKDNDDDNINPRNPPTSDPAAKAPSAVQVKANQHEAQAAIRSLKRHGASVQAAESPANVQQNLSAGNIPPKAPKAPMAPKATTSGTTRSGRVVKPSQKARDVKGVMNKKRTSTSEAATRTRTRTRTRSGKGGKGGATRSNSAPPPAATVNTTVTRSGRVVKPSLKAREMGG
ncbi:hypothetical protein NEUTE1DRAFT_139903 [Neurospora tetrasperma FGSC 2508]|uniref:Uncharacterized protein n=1 Tax=Neurospora tetrasperma (strain FGSC 2508 / ATCC MYA-4615 / P0657) TaxID=510951 RepID=F8MUH1_NEUT8|nr:uncharacterized protein NEUTE1DRAFT_139903 [Neurospora tetrasperma FGSC 2508]EGO55653.1 hypothetical protein NEUTE1DRAFT_139903 [Neurospora tetrasperma FGSC 2508]EGZ69102.1 hypothetical protein NEUTE2DRAFT_70300 [Neurospora tetrasperma FGSC 2509]